MEILQTVILVGVETMKSIVFTYGDFSFSMWHVFLFSMFAGFVGAFLWGILK
jgi:hypothetical protein